MNNKKQLSTTRRPSEAMCSTAFPEAQFFLATCYGNAGLGLQVDHEKAFNLYVQASKQNHPKATYRAAVCYELGAGTKKDYSRAIQFYRKAATLGDPAAMYKLGVIQLNGLLNQQKNPLNANSDSASPCSAARVYHAILLLGSTGHVN